MYDAFGWQPPKFAHVGLLVDEQRQKLSKRHAGVDISEYQSNATLPLALLNFSVLLGWSKAQKKGPNSDVMTLQEMIDNVGLGCQLPPPLHPRLILFPVLSQIHKGRHQGQLWQAGLPAGAAYTPNHTVAGRDPSTSCASI